MANNQTGLGPLVAELLCYQAQLTATLNQLATRFRQIPPIIKITKHEEFPSWRNQLRQTLKRFDLEKYILNDIPAPEDPEERRQWSVDRAEVDGYIQSTVPDHNVWVILKGMGWESTDVDPKKTFDMLTQYFWRGTDDSMAALSQEFAELRLEAFENLESFHLRVTYLYDRLEETSWYKNERYYMDRVLTAISRRYPVVYGGYTPDIVDGLSWSDLMAQLRRMVVDENTQRGRRRNYG